MPIARVRLIHSGKAATCQGRGATQDTRVADAGVAPPACETGRGRRGCMGIGAPALTNPP